MLWTPKKWHVLSHLQNFACQPFFLDARLFKDGALALIILCHPENLVLSLAHTRGSKYVCCWISKLLSTGSKHSWILLASTPPTDLRATTHSHTPCTQPRSMMKSWVGSSRSPCKLLHATYSMAWGHTKTFLGSWNMILSKLKQGSVFLTLEQQNTERTSKSENFTWSSSISYRNYFHPVNNTEAQAGRGLYKLGSS